MISLVGYTGFVGSNLANSYRFGGLFNSKNIQASFNTKPDLLIYSGVRAEKFLANKDEKADFAVSEQAIYNIKSIQPKRLVLISTVDVYKNPIQVDEDTTIDTKNLQPYGRNRYYLEQWVANNIKKYLIVRLPGLYGINLKKNFIFDMINIIPTMLTESKYLEVKEKSILIQNSYEKQDNGFYRCKSLDNTDKEMLKREFVLNGFSALNFTDSRAFFQFYHLVHLWNHVQIALKNDIRLLNITAEPVRIDEIYRHVFSKEFVNELSAVSPCYDCRTKYSELFGGVNGYIFDKTYTMDDIKQFVETKR